MNCVLWPKRRLRADQFPLVPGFVACGLGDCIGGVLHNDGPLLRRINIDRHLDLRIAFGSIIRAARVDRILLGFERGLVVVAPLNYTADLRKLIAIPVDLNGNSP